MFDRCLAAPHRHSPANQLVCLRARETPKAAYREPQPLQLAWLGIPACSAENTPGFRVRVRLAPPTPRNDEEDAQYRAHYFAACLPSTKLTSTPFFTDAPRRSTSQLVRRT